MFPLHMLYYILRKLASTRDHSDYVRYFIKGTGSHQTLNNIKVNSIKITTKEKEKSSKRPYVVFQH